MKIVKIGVNEVPVADVLYEKIRTDAIDELMKEIKGSDRYKYFTQGNVLKVLRFEEDIEKIAKRLKEQNK